MQCLYIHIRPGLVLIIKCAYIKNRFIHYNIIMMQWIPSSDLNFHQIIHVFLHKIHKATTSLNLWIIYTVCSFIIKDRSSQYGLSDSSNDLTMCFVYDIHTKNFCTKVCHTFTAVWRHKKLNGYLRLITSAIMKKSSQMECHNSRPATIWLQYCPCGVKP